MKIEDWEEAEGVSKRLALVVCCPTYFMAQQEVIENPPKSFNGWDMSSNALIPLLWNVVLKDLLLESWQHECS